MLVVLILQQFDEVALETDVVAVEIDEHDERDDNVEFEDESMDNPNSPIQIDLDDIQKEVDFWNSDVVCYVVEANPPIKVMEGLIRRIWKQYKMDKVVIVKKGTYLARFSTMHCLIGLN